MARNIDDIMKRAVPVPPGEPVVWPIPRHWLESRDGVEVDYYEVRKQEPTMLICDRCEGRKDVKTNRFTAQVMPTAQQQTFPENWAVVDLCEPCRAELGRDVAEFVKPLPKVTKE